jgi:CRISPR-associated exonuclease Cas4
MSAGGETIQSQELLAGDILFTVTDLKQYSYCGRVFFYEKCLPHIRPRTHKMDIGRDEHEREQARASRRTLRQYGEVAGRREFEVGVESAVLRLRGLIDEVVFTEDGKVLPVDYKLATSVSANHRLQLGAYALLLESKFGVSVSEGYVYLLGKREMVRVRITPALREQIFALLGAMFETVSKERMPEAASIRARCASCEFRRFCNDV